MAGLIRRLVERNLPLTDYDAWRRSGFTLSATSTAGRTITPTTAMQSIAVFACVRVLSETIGTLPLLTYRRRSARGKERDPNHALYTILHDLPNPEMTSVELREAIVGHLALRGNAYLEVVRDRGGTVRELWPLRPDQMEVTRERVGAPLTYVYTIQGRKVPMATDRICHLRGLSSDGVHGYSPIALARDAIGLTLATEEYGARWFSGGAQPGGVLQVQGKLSQEAADRLRDSWSAAHGGLDRSHRVAVLEEGVSWQQIGIAPEDSQFLETRKFQTEEIARLFRIPPHLIQSLERSTFNNIEHQSLDFVVHTIRPWLVRIEQAFQRDLFGVPSQNFCEFLVDGLLRGDLASRYAAYAIGRNWGWLSGNDVREIENMNPLPADHGDIYLQPLNMVEAGTTPEPAGNDDEAQRALLEVRAGGSAATRQRLRRAHLPLFFDAARRLVAREAAEVRSAADRYLNRRDAVEFSNWLREFYGRFGATATRAIMPLALTYAGVIAEDAAAEIAASPTPSEDLEVFVRNYAEKFGDRHSERSVGQLQAILSEAAVNGDDPLESIVKRLDEWLDTRPRKIADLESTRLSGAATRGTWKRNGITKIRWVTHGKSCGFCSRLNGRVVGIEQTFAASGDEVEGNEGQPKMKIRRPTLHPPLHRGCDCGLKPERG